MSKALFLDRDGVINLEKNYLYQINEFDFIDGVFDAVKFFMEKRFKIVVITNQAGIARGVFSEKDFLELSDWMLARFREVNCEIDAIYFCPHHPDYTGVCDCRKPSPGMLLRASQELKIDLSRSILVGDKVSDVKAGINAGVGFNVLVESGHLLNLNDKSCADICVPSIASYSEIFSKYSS